MRQSSQEDTLTIRPDNTSPCSPISVCIHTLRPANEDVRALRTALALSQAGFLVSIVDVEHDPARARDETLRSIRLKFIAAQSDEELASVRVRHVFISGRLMQYYNPIRVAPWMLFKALRILRGTVELLHTPADVYHASDITALPGCYVAARLRRKPLVFEPYELPLVQPWIARRPFLQACCIHLLRRLLPQCSSVIVTSPRYAVEFQRRYGGSEPAIIRNIPLYQPPVSSDRIREYLGVSSAVRITLYQGGLNSDRGLDTLVRAAKYLNAGTVIVLKAWGEDQAALESLIAQEGVGDRVKFVPQVPYEELQAWTGSADIGLIIYQPRSLSVQLTLPNKLFEYLMAGIPVLASPLDAVADVLRAYDVGRIVTFLEPREVGRAINAMLADKAGLVRMRANALAASQRDLCWEVESQKLLQLYEGIPGIARTALREAHAPQLMRIGDLRPRWTYDNKLKNRD
jgi:glycosyltransferase involved in cell wall biosynthesis